LEWNEKYSFTTEKSEFESLKEENSIPLHVVETGSDGHPTSYPMDIGDSFSGG
jgi:hypothetical protein